MGLLCENYIAYFGNLIKIRDSVQKIMTNFISYIGIVFFYRLDFSRVFIPAIKSQIKLRNL